MFNTKTYLLSFIFLFCSFIIKAQIRGTVINEENNPLEYASIAIYQQNPKTIIDGGVTDAKGQFELNGIQDGEYLLEVSFIGYVKKTISNITIKEGVKDLGDIALKLGNKLNNLTITAEKATTIHKIDRKSYNAKKFLNTQGGTATDVIKNLPSVSTDGVGNIKLRGTDSFLLLIDGKPVQGDAASYLSQLPANAIANVEVITAPSAKYDPEGKGGIINIISKKGSTDGSSLQLNTNAGFPSIEDYNNTDQPHRYGIDLAYNYKKEQWNISVGANYQRNDINGRREGDVFTIVDDKITRFPSDGERSFDVENYTGRFTVDYTPSKSNNYSLGFYAGKKEKARTADILYYDNHTEPINGGSREFTLQYFNENLRIRRGDFILGSFDYGHTFDNSSKLNTSVLYEYTFLGGPTTNKNLAWLDTSQLLQDEFNTNDNPLHGIRGQVDYGFKPFSFGKLETGYQFRYLDHEGDFFYGRRNSFDVPFQQVDLFSSEIDLIRTIHSGYAQLSGSKNKWDYNAGVRLEVMDRELELQSKAFNATKERLKYSYEKLFPSATVQYNFNKKTNIKASYSKRVNRPNSFKLNPFREREHSETLEQGDKNLLPEFIDLVELGFTKKFPKGNSVSITGYFREVENIVNRVNQIFRPENIEDRIDPTDRRFDNVVLDRIYSNVGKGRSIGVELGTEIKPFHNWSNFIGANIYNFEIDGFYDGEVIDVNATQYTINANSTYKFNPTTSLQFTLNYLSKRKTAQGEDSEYYSPNLSLRKSFFDNSLVATLQWKNIDMGLLDTNEQRITTSRDGEFFTTTNYVYEVDMVLLNLTYNFFQRKNKAKFIESEFGKKEF